MAKQIAIPGSGVPDDDDDDEDRGGRPSWDDYWIEIAEVVKTRSNDPSCQVGAVIVRGNNILVSTGYNGFARGVQHHERRLVKEPGSPEKLRWMCHAEQNAIYNAARVGVSVEGATIYTSKFPCLICTNAIVQAGIVRVHTRDTKPYDDDLVADDGSRVITVLLEAGVKLEAPRLTIDFAIKPGRQEVPGSSLRAPAKVPSKTADRPPASGSGGAPAA